MARKPVFDICMLCGECPCECKKPTKKMTAKQASKSKPVVKEVPVPHPPGGSFSEPPVDVPAAPRLDPRAAMRAQAGRSRTVPVPAQAKVTPAAPVPNRVIKHVPQTTGDPVIDDAIRCLGPIMAPDEKVKYSDLLWSHTDKMARAADWRNRRREVLDGVDQGRTA